MKTRLAPKVLLGIVLLAECSLVLAQTRTLFEDNFDTGIDAWVLEAASGPGISAIWDATNGFPQPGSMLIQAADAGQIANYISPCIDVPANAFVGLELAAFTDSGPIGCSATLGWYYEPACRGARYERGLAGGVSGDWISHTQSLSTATGSGVRSLHVLVTSAFREECAVDSISVSGTLALPVPVPVFSDLGELAFLISVGWLAWLRLRRDSWARVNG